MLFLAAAGLSLALFLLAPLPWFGSPFSDILSITGLLIAAGGVFFDLAAMRALAKNHTTIMPHRRSDHLVTGGAYALTRNPIYLGNTLILLGAGLASGIAWFVPLGLAAAAATRKLAIEPEERHLEARLGKAFRDYRKRVRRWL